jgi:steroid 5-alpha reductase family enzyme
MNWSIYFSGLAAMAVFAFAGWLLSLYRNNVTHVDSMWSLFFVVAAFS